MRRTTLIGCCLVIALGGACAAPAPETGALGREGGKADRGADLAPVLIDESGEGETFLVAEGADVVVRLGSNPTTGYDWAVLATDRTFGYPEIQHEPGLHAVGSGGTTVLTWSTGGLVRAGGRHQVELTYKRAWEDEGIETFSFAVEIVPGPGTAEPGTAEPGTTEPGTTEPTDPSVALVIDETGDGGHFEVAEGADVVVRLPTNPSTGYDWHVLATDRTFGYPTEEDFEVDGEAVGAGGTRVLRWKTGGFVRAGGEHTVTLLHARSVEDEDGDTFSFTVTITAAEPAPGPGAGSVSIGVEDESTVVDAPEGYDVVVRLPANPTTGYAWEVLATDRTFGYPVTSDYELSSAAVGSGGTAVLTWKTGGLVRAGGEHTVTLTYKRPWEDEGEETFTFTVRVVSPTAAD